MDSAIIKALWFFVTPGAANIAAFFSVKLLPHFSTPMDFGLTFRNHRIFGDHKTIRGLIFAIIFGTLFFLLQKHLFLNFDFIKGASLLDYSTLPWYFGSTLSFGAILGDAIKSFFKRQINIPPGKSWFPFDQIDWIIGSLIPPPISFSNQTPRLYITYFIRINCPSNIPLIRILSQV